MLRNHRTAGRSSHSTATTTNPREPRGGTNTGGRSRRQTLGASLFKSLEQHSSAYYLGGQEKRDNDQRHHVDTWGPSQHHITVLDEDDDSTGGQAGQSLPVSPYRRKHCRQNPHHSLNNITTHHTIDSGPDSQSRRSPRLPYRSPPNPHRYRKHPRLPPPATTPRLPGQQQTDSTAQTTVRPTSRSRRHT